MMKININGIESFVEDNDRYLQINDIRNADLIRILERLQTDYMGYDIWFCYHNTEPPVETLNKIGAVLEDDNIEMRLTDDNFLPFETFDVVRVTDDNFEEFSAYHNERNPDMYWTSERIERDLSRWGIFTLWTDSKITGYILLSMWDSFQSEIYCVDATDNIRCQVLISSAAKYAFDNGKKELLYMADENTNGHIAAEAVGFTRTGFYKGYMK
jgi:hypothetical protein